MKHFIVTIELPATITKTLTVEAENENEARDRAMGWMNDVGQDYILKDEETSDWSDQDYENRRVTKVVES